LSAQRAATSGARARALAQLSRTVSQEAVFMASLDFFALVALLAAIGALTALCAGRFRRLAR